MRLAAVGEPAAAVASALTLADIQSDCRFRIAGA